jgi:hypothetical protein
MITRSLASAAGRQPTGLFDRMARSLMERMTGRSRQPALRGLIDRVARYPESLRCAGAK